MQCFAVVGNFSSLQCSAIDGPRVPSTVTHVIYYITVFLSAVLPPGVQVLFSECSRVPFDIECSEVPLHAMVEFSNSSRVAGP